MSTPITGVVEAINEKQTRIGPMYDVVVNGTKYGHGKYPPRDIKQGDTVEFQFTTKQNGQYTNRDIVSRTLRKVEGGVAGSQAQGGAPAPMANLQQQPARSGGYVAFDERQEIISKQAALNTAHAFVEFAAANGAVAALPKAAKDEERLTLMRAWWLDEAARVYALTTGRTWEMPEQEPATSPASRRLAGKGKAKPETSPAGSGSNDSFGDDFADDDIPF